MVAVGLEWIVEKIPGWVVARGISGSIFPIGDVRKIVFP